MESEYVYIKSDYDGVEDTLKGPEDFKDKSDYIEYCKRIAKETYDLFTKKELGQNEDTSEGNE